ncbi:hypothetical protein QFC22_002368 [Naganishia vaughanmartiniae]|uniref:Uncharacterized protein n=1 Tax=Naganishia vaughanmartiniae TaxID=1424756 RepID=A0ACC2XCT6_9TREE|nr:hypothetical protein QFC22_002368 [Naganishia vaughanmartiniae]
MNRVGTSYNALKTSADDLTVLLSKDLRHRKGQAKAKPARRHQLGKIMKPFAGITDSRIGSIEVKLKKLDGELGVFKGQLAKMRNGPGKQAVQQRALRVLQQKKMYQSQLDQLVQQTFNMEQTAMVTENLKNTMATVDAMKIANKEMKKQYGKIDIDKIESIHYDMEDLIEQANEIQETMGRTYGVPDEVDEADLEAELQALGDDLLEEEEMPSYLKDTTALPDFVDEAPVDAEKVVNIRCTSVCRSASDKGRRDEELDEVGSATAVVFELPAWPQPMAASPYRLDFHSAWGDESEMQS